MSLEDNISKNSLDAIKEVILSRLKHKFTGAFFISWGVWNWKIFYVTLFVKRNDLLTNKLDHIGQHYVDTNHILIYPLFSAATIILVAPILNGMANNWSDFISIIMKRLNMYFTRNTPISREERIRLINEFNQRETNYIKEIKDLEESNQKERERYRELISQMEDELNRNDDFSMIMSDHKSENDLLLSEDEIKRKTNRLIIEMKASIKSVIDEMAESFYRKNADVDDISNRLISGIDKIKLVIEQRLNINTLINTEIIQHEIDTIFGIIEDNVQNTAMELRKVSWEGVSFAKRPLNIAFEPLFTYLNQVSI